MSVLSLILCCSMLIGTTFAWFTDEVNSGANQILAGNLDVDVFYDNNGVEESIQGKDAALFENILWEPGAVAYENITVKNLGTLALKYALSVNFTNENYVFVDENGNKTPYGLSTALKVAIIERHVTETEREDLVASIPAAEWKYLQELVKDGVLYPVDEDTTTNDTKDYAVVIWWQPGEHDNNWNVNNDKIVSDYAQTNKNVLHIDLGINLIATQWTHESDSFNNQYDENTWIPTAGTGVGPAGKDIEVRNDSGTKIGSVLVDTDSLIDPSKDAEVTFAPSDYEGNFTVDTGMETLVYDITVTNLKEDNSLNVKTAIRLPVDLDSSTVKVYHVDEEITSVYNPNTGYVSFDTTGFSPFTVIYDAESKYVPPELPADLPVASVVRSSEYENTDLPWGSFGAWSPTAGLDSQLEAAYTFSCEQTLEEAKASPYANWYCDFYVELSKDLGANQIFLGGNYGSFGWVGFHNGDLTLDAETEIPLLGSVTTSPWTYLDVVQNVGTFICGVGDVNDALAGATFTVMLRLTNPENEAEYFNVAVINYTFE